MLTVTRKTTDGPVAVIAVAGRLTIGTDNERIETLTREVLEAGATGVVYELSGITHIDSTGIGRFISCMTLSLKHRAKIAMAAAPTQVRDAFRVTRLDSVFRFHDDAGAAVASFG
jgi:anti-anti-sigma factor